MLHSETGNDSTAQNPNTDKSIHGDWREERRARRQEWRENRHRFPFHGLFPGLTLVLLGTLFLLNQTGLVVGDRWWQSLLIGLGGIFIIDGLVHYVNRAYRHGSYGKFIVGLVLISIGTLFIIGLGQWWSIALIGAGVALLLRFLWRR
jgi:hypothetical protein